MLSIPLHPLPPHNPHPSHAITVVGRSIVCGEHSFVAFSRFARDIFSQTNDDSSHGRTDGLRISLSRFVGRKKGFVVLVHPRDLGERASDSDRDDESCENVGRWREPTIRWTIPPVVSLSRCRFSSFWTPLHTHTHTHLLMCPHDFARGESRYRVGPRGASRCAEESERLPLPRVAIGCTHTWVHTWETKRKKREDQTHSHLPPHVHGRFFDQNLTHTRARTHTYTRTYARTQGAHEYDRDNKTRFTSRNSVRDECIRNYCVCVWPRHYTEYSPRCALF